MLAINGDAMARPLLDALPPGRPGLAGLAVVYSSGGLLSPTVKADLARALPHARVLDVVGSTETGLLGMSPATEQTGPPELRITGTPGTIVVDDTGRPVPPGATGRGHVHDPPGAAPGQVGQAGPDHEHCAGQVDRERLLPGVDIMLAVEWPAGRYAPGVHQDVHRPEGAPDPLDTPGHGVGVADVDRFLAADVEARDLRPLGDQQVGRGPADAAGRAGHDGHRAHMPGTSMTTLPKARRSDTTRSAAAASASGNRCPMTGRTSPCRYQSNSCLKSSALAAGSAMADIP